MQIQTPPENVSKAFDFFSFQIRSSSIIMINFSKWSSGQVKSSFCQTYRNFFALCSLIFRPKSEQFHTTKSFQETFLCCQFFGGEKEGTFDYPDKINPREVRKLYRKHNICKSQLSAEDSSATLNAVLTSLLTIFCSKSKFLELLLFFRKKLFFSHFFSRHVKCSFNNLAYL